MRFTRSLSTAAIFFVATLSVRGAAQRSAAPQPEAYPDRIVVKFRDALRVRMDAGKLRAQRPGAGPARALLAGYRVERLFTRSEQDLDQERAQLVAASPSSAASLSDLNSYYRVRVAGSAQADAALASLRANPNVELAYREALPKLFDDIPPATPQLSSGQEYFGPAPDGYGYDAVSSIVGIRGQGAELAHLEGSWHLGHEDRAVAILGQPPSGAQDSTSWRNHGIACVGILAAHENGYGVRGFASAAKSVFGVSISQGAANSISIATKRLAPGSVMSSSWGYSDGFTNWPLDFYQAEFDAVRIATLKGIFYTFSAGNSGKSLEDAVFKGRYGPSAPSSGGFIIGATDGKKSVRASFSNFGKRVDANGWGRHVTTAGYGDLFFPGADFRQSYTSSFNGTSAAAPAVAGVIASYVHAVREQTGVLLTPDQVRKDLRAIGTPVSGGIGLRPNLVSLLASRGLPDGLRVTRDGALGKSFEVEVRGQAQRAWFCLLSVARSRSDVGLNRPLLLDPNGIFFAFGNIMSAGGQMRTKVALPNDARLLGQHWFLQAAVARNEIASLTNSAEVWIDPTRQVAPVAPSGLRLLANGQRQVQLGWLDNSPNEDSFVVRMSTDGASFRDALRVDAGIRSATISGLSPYTKYWFRVRAVNSAGSSPASNTLAVRTSCEGVGAPSVRVSSVKPRQITVVWTNGSPAASALHVGRSTDGKSFTRVASLPGTATGFTLTGLSPDRSYWIRVRAQNACSTKDSNVVTAKTEGVAPGTPTRFAASNVTYQRATLAWAASTNNTQGYEVFRSSDARSWTKLASLSATSFTATGLSERTRYYFGVRATNRWGHSPLATLSVTTQVGPPAPPSALRVVAARQRQFDLVWSYSGTTAQGFHVGVSLDKRSWSRVASLSSSARSFTITNLQVDTTYWVRIRAYNNYVSSPSVTSAATLPRPPAAPQNLRFSELRQDGFRITFSDMSSNEDGFRIYTKRPDIVGAREILRATLPRNDYDTRIVGLKSKKPYLVKVCAFNRGGVACSGWFRVTTK